MHLSGIEREIERKSVCVCVHVYRQCRWDATVPLREETAAIFVSWPGIVRPTAPAAASALKQWSCMDTSQTGNATPGRAEMETHHLRRGVRTFSLLMVDLFCSFFQLQSLDMYFNHYHWIKSWIWGRCSRERENKWSIIESTSSCYVLLCRFFNPGMCIKVRRSQRRRESFHIPAHRWQIPCDILLDTDIIFCLSAAEILRN